MVAMSNVDPMLDGITRWDVRRRDIHASQVLPPSQRFVMVNADDLPALITRVRAAERDKFVNPNCTWPDYYDPNCPTCRELETATRERQAGYDEGQRDKIEEIIAKVRMLLERLERSATDPIYTPRQGANLLHQADGVLAALAVISPEKS